MNSILIKQVKRLSSFINIPLVVFLLVFTVDKVILKAAGIVLIFLLHPDFKFKTRFRQIPSFYLFIILFEIVKFSFFNADFTMGHTMSFIVGCLFWLCSLLCVYQLQSLIQKEDKEKISRSIDLFFIVNVAISLYNIIWTMVHSGSINPYTANSEQFNTSTGDYIRGIFMGPCYINMMVNSFFIFYYLYKKRIAYSLFATVIAILTTCNFANLILLPILLVCFLFIKEKKAKWSIVYSVTLIILFYCFVSPSNLQYLKDSIWASEKQQQELIAYETAALNSDSNINNDISPFITLKLEDKYGKLLAFKETRDFLLSGPRQFLLGAGISNYSSFLALRTSGLNRSENSKLFNYLPEHRAKDFERDHYQIFKTIYSLPRAFHSIKHFPNSFINQLFGEYGIIGVLLFILFYVYYFMKHFSKLTYGKYLIFLLGGFLLFDYLFEYLSVVVIFELLMLVDLKEAQAKPQNSTGAIETHE